jgi:hypothetical protein
MDTKVTGDCSHSDNLREELRKEWQIISQVSWFTEWQIWDQKNTNTDAAEWNVWTLTTLYITFTCRINYKYSFQILI